MKDFFVGSSLFELPHIIMLILFAVVTITMVTLTLIFAKTEKQKTWVIKGTAMFLLALAILSRFVFYNFKPTFLDFFPNTFCSTMGFVMPLFVLFCKKDSKALFYAVFAGFIGGILTILVADFIGQEQVPNTIISFTYHLFMATLAILCYATRYSTFTLNKIPALMTGLSFMVVLGVFTNQVFNFSNNMFLNEEMISGISWWICGILMILIAAVVSIIYEAFTRKWKEQNLYKIGMHIKNGVTDLYRKSK